MQLLLTALLALAFWLPSTLYAQSIADAAAKENQRKKGKPVRVITEDDLKRTTTDPNANFNTAGATAAPSPTSTPGTAGAAAADKKSDKPEKTEEEIRADRQKDWSERRDKANEKVTQLKAEVDQLQLAANDVNAGAYSPARTQLLGRLEAAKRELAAAQAEVDSLENERRAAGFAR